MSQYNSIGNMWNQLEQGLIALGRGPQTLKIYKACFMLGAEAFNVVQRKLALDNADVTQEEGAELLKALARDVTRESEEAIHALAEVAEAPPKTGD